MLWDLLTAAGRHSEAMRQIMAVHASVEQAFGSGSIEQRMMDVRLGMSIAGEWRLGWAWGGLRRMRRLGSHGVPHAAAAARAACKRSPAAAAPAMQCDCAQLPGLNRPPLALLPLLPPAAQPAAGWRMG